MLDGSPADPLAHLHRPDARVLEFDPRDYFRLDPLFLAQYDGLTPEWGPLGAITFARTYPRFRYDLDRFETPAEVFARCVEAVMGTLHYRADMSDEHWSRDKAQRDGQEMFRRMWALKLLPAGRGLANLGTDAMLYKGAMCLNNCQFVSTETIEADIAVPFCDIMDGLMLGTGVGFDLRGAEHNLPVLAPVEVDESHVIEDTREGWVLAVARLLRAFRGLATLPRHWDTSRLRRKGEPLRTFGGVSSGPGPLIDLLRTLTGLYASRIGRTVDAEVIVDTANVIGRCVVAGGVRRSSEIAIGPMSGPGSDTFAGLKDPSGLTALYIRQGAVEASIPEVAALDDVLRVLRERQAAHSVLSPDFGLLQDEIDRASLDRKALCASSPEWLAVDAEINAHPLRAWRWASNNSVTAEVGADYTEIGRRIGTNGEPGVLWLDNVKRFGRMADGDLTRPRYVTPDMIPGLRADAACGANPCGEIALESGELCNLIEVFPGRHADVGDWLKSLKYAYFIGKAVSDLPMHNPRSMAPQQKNRRLGISISGIAEWYQRIGMDRMCEALDKGYRYLRSLDRLYSGWLGLPESVRMTTVKPSGTVSLLAGVEGGMRFPEAPFCARAIRIHDTSPLIDRLTTAGYRIEPDRYAPATVVAFFPMRDTRVGRYANEVSVWEQARIQVALQRYWSDNMVSATWMFRKHEAGDIAKVLAAHDRDLKGMSALPYDGHSYAQPPYAPITEREHDTMVSRTRPLDLVNLGAVRDSEERFCDSGVCSLVPAG